VERLQLGALSLAGQDLDALFCLFQGFAAFPGQLDATLKGLEGLLQAHVALLHGLYQGFQLAERLLESGFVVTVLGQMGFTPGVRIPNPNPEG